MFVWGFGIRLWCSAGLCAGGAWAVCLMCDGGYGAVVYQCAAQDNSGLWIVPPCVVSCVVVGAA